MVVVVLKASQQERHHVGVQPSKDTPKLRGGRSCAILGMLAVINRCVCVCALAFGEPKLSCLGSHNLKVTLFHKKFRFVMSGGTIWQVQYLEVRGRSDGSCTTLAVLLFCVRA